MKKTNENTRIEGWDYRESSNVEVSTIDEFMEKYPELCGAPELLGWDHKGLFEEEDEHGTDRQE